VSAVLVTGAAGDIGRAIAVRLAQDGRAVVVADQPGARDQLLTTAHRCGDAGVEVRVVTFDVTDEQSASDVVGALGALGGLVTSAGYQGAFAPVDAYPLPDARRVLEVNVLGVLTVVAAAARLMIAGGRAGAIVNIASMAGVSGAPNMPAYSASKAAVVGFTKAAAKDLAPHGIRVNAVSPGFIGPGRMWDAQVAQQAGLSSHYYASDPDEVAAQMTAMVPLRRYGGAGEVASVVAFLLSDAASYVTGVNIEVSGGSA
jgi:NAD(P)-dependent dehydrogenase (short-subunit alcohol dehydrogenase family)